MCAQMGLGWSFYRVSRGCLVRAAVAPLKVVMATTQGSWRGGWGVRASACGVLRDCGVYGEASGVAAPLDASPSSSSGAVFRGVRRGHGSGGEETSPEGAWTGL